MAYYCKMAGDLVDQVIKVNNEVITDAAGNEDHQKGIDFIKNLEGHDPAGTYLRASFGTIAGKHYEVDPITGDRTLSADQSKSFRKNCPSKGWTYDSGRDAFIAPKRFDSWVLDEETCIWEPPIPMPDDGKVYLWNEGIQNWEEQ